MTKIYIADVKNLDVDSALERVSEYRRKKALRMKNDADKRRCLGVELLQRVFGEGFSYAPDENGKPRAEGVYFSLSHSGNYAVCAVGESDLGVDIEQPRKNVLPTAKRFFTAEEYEKIAASDFPEEEFCALWVLKEACIKCSGAGLRELSSVRVSDYCTRHFVYEGCHVGVASEADLGETEIITAEI